MGSVRTAEGAIDASLGYLEDAWKEHDISKAEMTMHAALVMSNIAIARAILETDASPVNEPKQRREGV